MLKKIDIADRHAEVFGNPAPMGLMGLAIACFALVPMAFGAEITPATLKTAAVYALLFGTGCQFLAGMMDFANRNYFGGSIFTTFSFLWMKNAWELHALSKGIVPDHSITFAVDALLLVVFIVLAYGFGHFSTTLFIFLVDIDLIYVCKLINHVTHSQVMALPVGVFTALLGIIALWIAFASLINPVAGREIFKESKPVFRSARKKNFFDFTLRNAIFAVLYEHWKDQAYEPLPLEELQKRLKERIGEHNSIPDLFYLMEYGVMVLSYSEHDVRAIKDVRLNASGIDIYEQLILRKYDF